MNRCHPYFPRDSSLAKGFTSFGMPGFDPARDFAVKHSDTPGTPFYSPARPAVLQAIRGDDDADAAKKKKPAPVLAGQASGTVLAGGADPFAAR